MEKRPTTTDIVFLLLKFYKGKTKATPNHFLIYMVKNENRIRKAKKEK